MKSTEVKKKKLTLGYKQNKWSHDFTITDSVLLNTLYDTLPMLLNSSEISRLIPVAPYCYLSNERHEIYSVRLYK